MKPEYVNTFALRKVVNKEGEALEITLDASHKYMENSVTVTSNRPGKRGHPRHRPGGLAGHEPAGPPSPCGIS